MAIKLGEKELFPHLGDYGPVNIYKGEQKLAGYKWAEKSGQELHFDNTYNSLVQVEVDGQSYQRLDPNARNMAPTKYEDWLVEHHYGNEGALEARSNRMAASWLIEVESNKSYYYDTGNPDIWYAIRTLDSNKTIESESWGGSGSSGVKTTNSTTKYLGVGLYAAYAASDGAIVKDEFQAGNIKPIIQDASITDRSFIEYVPKAPSPDYPIEIHSVNDFDVVSSTEKLTEGQLQEYDYGVEYENVDKINLNLGEPLRSVGDVKVERNTIGGEDKIYPLQSLDDWGRYYKNSPAIVTNPNDTAYQKWGFDGIPLENMEQVRGGMFNNAFPINGHLNGGIDTPGTAWAGINISKMYLETNDDVLLPKIKAIGDFFLNHVMDIDIWGIPFKAMPNTVTFDEVSRQWIPSTRFIHTRTFYHVAWALLEIYDATKDTKYSNLAGQLLDGATIIQLIATGQANSNELPPYFSGAMFNAINNVGGASYEPDLVTFTNTSGDVVVRATNKWIKLFGNTTRTSFDLYEEVDVNYTVKSIADNYINHLVYLYNNQELRKPDGHNLLYCFSHYEWEDEPHPDGYMIPVPMNWDFIDGVFGKDQWFTGDLMFWMIIGFAEAGETQIATSLLDRYYELKAPDSEGRLLFHDRYTAQGTPLVNDTSKSIAFTGLYMQARNILGNHDYDAESISSLEYYQKESAFNTVDGGFSWDTEEYNSFIENKSLGEITYSVMENASNRTPAPEDITEDTDHPLVDKVNLSLSEPLRSRGNDCDRLIKDSDGLWKIERNIELIHPEDGTRTIEETYGVLDSPIYEVLPQGYQDRLNTLKSFHDSNYVYTVQNTDNLHKEELTPTIHAKTEVKDI